VDVYIKGAFQYAVYVAQGLTMVLKSEVQNRAGKCQKRGFERVRFEAGASINQASTGVKGFLPGR
jgi:hypothetical protein